MQTDRRVPAEEILVQLLEGRRRVLGDKHRDMLSSAENLAVLYDKKETLEARKEILEGGDLEIHESMKNSTLTYWRQRRWKNADILLVQRLESRSQALGNGDPEAGGVWLKHSKVSWSLRRRRYDARSALQPRISRQVACCRSSRLNSGQYQVAFGHHCIRALAGDLCIKDH